MGVSALDENSCANKACTRAKTYLPSKPDKYAIRFYAVIGHKYVYLSSMFDNRAGNKTGVLGVQDYCRLFHSLRMPYYKVTADQESLTDTPSALWMCMMGHQTASLKAPNGRNRNVFCDNFYTRHSLAAALGKFTDGEAKIVGTVKFTNLDATNRYRVSQGIEWLKDANRGEWV